MRAAKHAVEIRTLHFLGRSSLAHQHCWKSSDDISAPTSSSFHTCNHRCSFRRGLAPKALITDNILPEYRSNCTRFVKLILRKISKIVATRYHRPILKLKCTRFDFGWGSAPVPAGFMGPTSDRKKGRTDGTEGQGKEKAEARGPSFKASGRGGERGKGMVNPQNLKPNFAHTCNALRQSAGLERLVLEFRDLETSDYTGPGNPSKSVWAIQPSLLVHMYREP